MAKGAISESADVAYLFILNTSTVLLVLAAPKRNAYPENTSPTRKAGTNALQLHEEPLTGDREAALESGVNQLMAQKTAQTRRLQRFGTEFQPPTCSLGPRRQRSSAAKNPLILSRFFQIQLPAAIS